VSGARLSAGGGFAGTRFVVVVCGLALEARIAAGPGVRSVAGGVDARRLAAHLEREVARGARAVVSFGIAGALAPELAAGECVIARGVVASGRHWPCDEAWTARLRQRVPDARFGDLAASDRPLASAAQKRAMFERTNALAVDTESHVAAAIAAVHRLPFAAIRVIADAAPRDLPRAASVALKPGGRVDVARVAVSILAAPSQVRLLARTARDARVAFAALRDVRKRVGDDLGF
jgi:hopanoid-associated phosphorylase